jgi:hypothetical protein
VSQSAAQPIDGAAGTRYVERSLFLKEFVNHWEAKSKKV